MKNLITFILLVACSSKGKDEIFLPSKPVASPVSTPTPTPTTVLPTPTPQPTNIYPTPTVAPTPYITPVKYVTVCSYLQDHVESFVTTAQEANLLPPVPYARRIFDDVVHLPDGSVGPVYCL